MAANFSQVGINFDVFSNTTFSAFDNLTNLTRNEFIDSIPATANSVTDGYYGIVVMIVLGIVLMQLLSDISQYGLFRYSTVRSIGIALGIVSTIGIRMLSVGYMTNFVHLSIVITLFILVLVYIIISNPT